MKMGIIWGCLILGGMITLFSEEEKYKNIIFRTFNHQNSNNIINQLETKKNVMMPINNNGNREQERAELYKTIWQIANDLRGSVDGWDFKQYVLGFLFYRFISENLTHYINEQERKHNPDFDYAQLSDEQAEFGRADTVREKGFFILPSELFRNVQARAKSDSNLNETLSRIFRNIENSAKGTESESDLKGLFDDVDLNSNKLGNSVEKRNQKLVKLIDAIGNMPLSNGKFTENTIDLFGDAYEFLMTMYASNAGKSGGEFFTPQEVSELLARIATVGKTEVNKVYDPACGSGSLLLKFSKILGKDKVRIGYFGQEINLTTYNLCRINMFLHNINYNFFDIAHGDTLTDPKHWDDEPFDAIVSNPPYSINWEGDKNPVLINDPRFAPAGVLAPKSKADLAFVMHMLAWLSPSGTAAIVCFPGVLYRGGAEQKIRKYLVDNNYVDCVIQLPPDLFFGTTIATCILVLKKNKKDNHLLFIDASEEFVRSGNKNKLTEGNIAKIMKAFTERTDMEHFARLVHNDEIGKNDYNLAVSGYVAKKEEREEVDIDKLNAEITEIVARQQKLRAAIDEIVSTLQ
jgi:type I restriction enzyme M protein